MKKLYVRKIDRKNNWRVEQQAHREKKEDLVLKQNLSQNKNGEILTNDREIKEIPLTYLILMSHPIHFCKF